MRLKKDGQRLLSYRPEEVAGYSWLKPHLSGQGLCELPGGVWVCVETGKLIWAYGQVLPRAVEVKGIAQRFGL